MSVSVSQSVQSVTVTTNESTVTVQPVTQSVTVTAPGPQGATGPVAPRYYGAFQDLGSQSITSTTTAYPMTLDTTDYADGFYRGTPTSRIYAQNSGTYNLQWSGQFQNTDNQDQDATIWLRINGTDVPGSAGYISVPSSHGGTPGHMIAAWNYIIPLTAGQYFEFIWQATNTAVTLHYYAAGTNPTRPSTASLIVTATMV